MTTAGYLRWVVATLAIGVPLISANAQTSSTNAAPKNAESAAKDSDEARREKIFASDRWKQVQQEYQKWLATQVIYTPEQIKELNARIAAEVRRLSADELEEFLDDWSAKLKVLLGKDADEARDWLGVYLTNMAEGYRKQYLQRMGLSDLSRISAADLESAYARLRAGRISAQATQAQFERTRQQSLEAIRQQTAATQTAQQQNLALRNNQPTPPPPGYQSPYTPPRPQWRPPQVQFWVDSNGRIVYGLPW